ncbi:MAG: YggS family pyridoxal phosphate-dependent enzyme, partial [Paratractidigestivibacter faecalis]
MSDTFDQTYADFSAARRAQIMARIEAACARVGRDVSEVSPVAVSKTVGTGELLAAWRAGWRRFAENRPQELTRKLAFVGQTPEMAGAA